MKPLFCLLIGALMLAGCGTSPEPDYFSLAPAPGPIVADVNFAVRVQRPYLPAYLDRPDIVAQDSTYQVQIDNGRRWAEPLDEMFERILTEDLKQRLPKATVMAEDDGAPPDARVTLALDIQQFNRISEGQAGLQAQLTVKDKGVHAQPPQQRMQYTVKSGSSAPATAESLSQLVGKLADSIAGILHSQAMQADKPAPPLPEPEIED